MTNYMWAWNELKEWVEKASKELLLMARNANNEQEQKRLFARHREMENFTRKMDELMEEEP